MKILVTGATGIVGRHVVDQLVRAGLEVRALTRNPAAAKLPPQVEVFQGDLAEPDSVAAALDGVERMYLFSVEESAREVVAQAKQAGVRRIVVLSAASVTAGLHASGVEQAVEESGLEWTHVRPCAFMTNMLQIWAPSIQAERVVRYPFADEPMNLIHEADIAAVAVKALLSDELAGKAPVLSGPAAITQAEQVRIIGSAVGREVRWEELPPEEAVAQMAAAWGDPVLAREAVSAWGSFVTAPEEVTDTVERLTGRPARSFAEWAADHAADFR